MPQAIVEHARDGDVVIAMGAGSIGSVPAQVVELVREGGMSAIDVTAALGKVAVLMGGTLGRARDLADVGQRRARRRCASQGVDAHAFDPAERELGELKREGFARCFVALHGRHGEDGTRAGRARAARHSVHRLGRDGVGDRDGQGDDQAGLARRGPADAALRAPRRRPAGARAACAPCPTSSACR